MRRTDYGGALLRRWWLIVVLGVVGAVAGVLLAPSHTHVTSTQKWKTTTLVGAVPPSGAGANGVLGSGVGTNQILFYAHEGSVINAAAAAVGLRESPSQLASAITVTGPAAKTGQVGVVKLSAVANSPQSSAAFTNAYAAQLGDYLNNLAQVSQKAKLQQAQQRVAALQSEIASAKTRVSPNVMNQLNAALAQVQQLSSAGSPTGYTILQPAAADSATKVGHSTSGIPTGRLTWAIAGLILGSLLGAAIVVLIAFSDTRLRSSATAEGAFGYRVITEIPATGGGGKAAALASMRDEAYRKLQMSVLLEPLQTAPHRTGDGTGNYSGNGVSSPGFGARPAPPRAEAKRQVLLVVSSGTEPSRPFVVENLAATYAEAGQRVLVASTLDLPATAPGEPIDFSGTVSASELQACIQPSRLKNVAVLSLGRLIPSAGQILARAPAILDASRQMADIVILEAPPLLAFHDGEALTSVADAVIVVGECGFTTLEQAHDAGDLLGRIAAPVLGIALTNAPATARDLRQARRTQAGGAGRLGPLPGPAPEKAGTGASGTEA